MSTAVERCRIRTTSRARVTVTGTVTNTAKAIITDTTGRRRPVARTGWCDMGARDERVGLNLARDQVAMEWWYPQFRLLIPMLGPIHWRGRIRPFRTRVESYELVVIYRTPVHTIPQIWVVEPEISRRTHILHPHLHADGSICSFFPPDGTYSPQSDDISRLVDLASDWLRRHIYFEEYRRWPGPEAPHEPHDVLRALARRPDARCICGRKQPFRLCCKRRYELLAATSQTGKRLSAEESRERMWLEQLLRKVRQGVGAQTFASIRPELGPPIWLLKRDSETSVACANRVPNLQAQLDRRASDVATGREWTQSHPSTLPVNFEFSTAEDPLGATVSA